MALFISNDDMRQLVTPEIAIEVMEDVYREMARGTGVTRTRTQTHVPSGEEGLVCRFKTMDGAITKYRTIGLRILPDMIRWPKVGENRRQVYKPVKNGRFLAFDMIFSAETGDLLAVLQDAVLQRLRITGAHGAAAKVLARRDSHVIGLLGSGWLAGGILEGLCFALPITQIRVFSPTVENRRRFATQMTQNLGIPVTAVDSPEVAYRGADVVVTCTNSIDPIFRGAWLEQGMHLTSVLTWEVDDECYTRSDLTVLSLREGHANEGINYAPETIKDKVHLEIFTRNIAWNNYVELGEILTGTAKGRSNEHEITFFANNLGFGAQFGALGGRIYQLARTRSLGREFSIEDWYEPVR